ncbi:MAG TPA: DUF1080 domain-containing protein [Longimicrobiaceae bacterium]|nr:DUF1080 domain-containing protein [Longimicrobiaceae bacterium]
MRTSHAIVLLVLAAGCSPAPQPENGGPAKDAPAVNQLTAQEQADGWRLLFDGRTTAGWRGYRQAAIPAGWQVVDGALTRVAQAGDIVTEEEFDSFELALEWRVASGGNSGVFFHVVEDSTLDYVWRSGPEMQVLDNAAHPDGRDPLTSAGSNFALHAPVRDVTRPAGEWNAARLVVDGAHVEHWLNGVRLLEYELGSADWEARVRGSKFAAMPRYGRAPRGHLALQDHGDRVAFRSIRIRTLPAR